jgi:hypothetical protein
MMTLLELKAALRSGPYAWPGGYPVFFFTAYGEALSFEAVKGNWREVCAAMMHKGSAKDWEVVSSYINWEDPDLYCAHTGERIESAYAEPEEGEA